MPFLIVRLAIRARRFVVTVVGLLLAASASAQTSPPPGWLEANVGGGPGSWSFDAEGFAVTGAGTDIWGTSDSFHFVYQQLNGDGEFRARLLSLDATHPWAKAGLMLRASLDPRSAHHSLLASQGNGIVYQRRPSQGSASLNTLADYPTTRDWMRIVRIGTQVTLGMSEDGVNWWTVARLTWPTGPTYVGFAVSSHDASTQPSVSARFYPVALTANGRSEPFVTVTAPQSGEMVRGDVPYTIRWDANSTDGDRLDHFNVYAGTEQGGQIFYNEIPGCSELPATARSCTWSTPGPTSDGAHVLVLAVDALNDEGRDDSGRFSIAVPPSGVLPSGWSSHDIGAVAAAGSASATGSTFTVRGSGADVWGTADEFHFARTTMEGDFTITARVTSVEPVNAWTKAGLMVRAGLAPNAQHGFLFATPTTVKGVAFQYRSSIGATSGNQFGPALAPSVWLKLVRRNSTLSSYYRHRITDPWTLVKYQVYDSLPGALDVGLAVSSHVDGRVATAQFSDVSVEPLPPWQLGTVASQGSASMDETLFGLFGKGSDIWSTADAFVYGFTPWIGDGTMTARVTSLQSSSPWAKAGVMFRESITPGSKHVFAMVTPARGAALQSRPVTSGQSVSNGSASGAAPAWVRLTRTGDTFVGKVSTDGVTWTTIGSATVQMPQTIWVGIAHTSHNTSDAGGAMFDDLRITR